MEFCVCFRRFFVFGIVIINAIVALLGLVLLIYGGVSLGQGKDYFAITSGTATFTRVPVLMIIVGLFITIVGIVGAVGAFFSSTAFGRVMLLVYSVILALLVVCEFGGGIAAGVLRTTVETFFTNSANDTFRSVVANDTNNQYRKTWDNFQQTFQCCGVKSYTDWSTILNQPIPLSCCPPSTSTCDSNADKLYRMGCVTKVVSEITKYFAGIAAGAILFALLQVFGIVASCFVVFYKPQDKYEVV
ncbi:hypothetical protein EMCRGX_G023038 [Ephydatia muelleri]